MDITQYSPEAVRYMQRVFFGPPESWTQTASRSLQPFLSVSLGERPTDRKKDHAIRSLTIGGAHSGEAKLCYGLPSGYSKQLLEQSTRQIGSTSAINSYIQL